MFKSLRVPEKLFAFVMWLVSVVFAGFLIGLGGKVVADLPRLEGTVSLEQFAEPAALQRGRSEAAALEKRQAELSNRRARAQLAVTSAAGAYQSERAKYENWLATRTATTDASGNWRFDDLPACPPMRTLQFSELLGGGFRHAHFKPDERRSFFCLFVHLDHPAIVLAYKCAAIARKSKTGANRVLSKT